MLIPGCGPGVAGGMSWVARRTASAGMEIVLNFGICSYIDSMSVASPLFPVWGRSSAFAAGGGLGCSVHVVGMAVTYSFVSFCFFLFRLQQLLDR